MKDKVSVLFICMGNICRSPTAEGVFSSLIQLQNLSDSIATDSAGTHAYHIGNPPDSRAQVIASHHGIDLSDLTARKITTDDFTGFDYIIVMDKENLINVNKVKSNLTTPSKASIHLFMEFAEKWPNDEVPDPYYGGDNGFEEVFQMVTDASQGLLDQIVQDQIT